MLVQLLQCSCNAAAVVQLLQFSYCGAAVALKLTQCSCSKLASAVEQLQ